MGRASRVASLNLEAGAATDEFSSSHTFSGTTPDRYINGTVSPLSIPITIASTNTSDTLTLTSYVAMDILPYFFTTFNLPNASVTPGSFFSWSLGNYVVNKTAIINANGIPFRREQLAVVQPFQYDPHGYGAQEPQLRDCRRYFPCQPGRNTATTDLKVAMTGVTATTSSTGTAAVSTSSSGSSSSGGLSKGAKIGIGIACGLIAMILLLLLLFCCCRRRKQRQAENDTRDNDADSFVVGSPHSRPTTRSERATRSTRPETSLERSQSSRRLVTANPSPTRSARPAAPPAVLRARQWRRDHTGLTGSRGFSSGAKSHQSSTPLVWTTARAASSATAMSLASTTRSTDPAKKRARSLRRSVRTPSRPAQVGRAGGPSTGARPRMRVRRRTTACPRPRVSLDRDKTSRRDTLETTSPTALARLTSIRDVEGDASPEFSEFGSGEGHMSPGSHEESSNFVSGGSSGSVFAGGPSGLSRFGDSQGFKTDDEEADTTDHEGPAVVTVAERQSFETRRPSMNRPTPKLRPSKERVLSPVSNETKRSSQALTGRQSGAFDDAEDPRNSVYAPSTSYEPSEVQGLGYPASAIYFSSPNPDDGQFSNRGSTIISDGRASTIQALRTDDHQHPLSPPLPQVGSFVRPRPISTFRPTSQPAEGRVHAVANETFSIHPPINPPPTVSLSAATWSSNPPSTYRAVAEGGMPAWLHFDARELELWGVPGLANSGDVTAIRIIETLPRDKRRSDPTQSRTSRHKNGRLARSRLSESPGAHQSIAEPRLTTLAGWWTA